MSRNGTVISCPALGGLLKKWDHRCCTEFSLFPSSQKKNTSAWYYFLTCQKKNVKILTIGKKSRDFFNKIFKDKIINSYIDLGATGAGYEKALEISNYIQKQYFENNFDICKIIFNKFKSAITQEVSHQQIIPLDIKISNEEEIQNSNDKENRRCSKR